MKHKFLLDKNILYHAMRGCDAQDKEDYASADLVQRIMKNCHQITVDRNLFAGYCQIVDQLKKELASHPKRALLPYQFGRQFLGNPRKIKMDFGEIATLSGEEKYRPEDRPIVRAAVHFKVPIITADEKLGKTVNAEKPGGISAIYPKDALALVDET